MAGLSDLSPWRLAFGFEWYVNVMPTRSVLSLVPDANIVGPPRRLHEQDEGMIGNGNLLKPRLPLVRVPGMFLQQRFYLLDGLRALLPKDLVSDGPGKHMAGYVPCRSGKGQYDNREKYEGCD